jgi:hypothetical protein
MQMTFIEKNILSAVHDLPIDKQKEILDFSLFLKSNEQRNEEINESSFNIALHDFLNEVKADPLDTDTTIFDCDREKTSGRDFQL